MDGHEFIPEAIRKGAKAIVVQEETDDIQGVTIVRVNNTNRALAILADKFYGSPSSSMKVIGVTGTNGKTTVTHMIEAIFRDQKDRTGLIGTMYRRIGEKTYPTANTTPDILTLQKTFAEMKKENVKAAAIEVSQLPLFKGEYGELTSIPRSLPTLRRIIWTTIKRWQSTRTLKACCSLSWETLTEMIRLPS